MPIDWQNRQSVADQATTAPQQPAAVNKKTQTLAGQEGAPIWNKVAPAAPKAPPNEWSLKGGFDLSGPGAAEDAYGRYGNQLANPGATEAYVGSNDPASARNNTATGAYTNQYNPMGQPSALQSATAGGVQGAQNATASGQYWNSLQGQQNVPKDMSAYYDRQYERGAQRVNDQAGARGMYNSSAAMDQLSQFGADLGGQQARDEAQYGLQSAQLSDSIMRGAAGAADSAGVGRFNSQVGAAQSTDQTGISKYLAGLSGVGQADEAGLGLYGSGLQGVQASDSSLTGRLGVLGQGAVGADNSRIDRVNGVYGNLSGLTDSISGVAGAGYADALASDQGLFDTGQQLSLGAGLANLTGVQTEGALKTAGAQAVGQGATNAATTALSLSKK